MAVQYHCPGATLVLGTAAPTAGSSSEEIGSPVPLLYLRVRGAGEGVGGPELRQVPPPDGLREDGKYCVIMIQGLPHCVTNSGAYRVNHCWLCGNPFYYIVQPEENETSG